MLVRKVSKAQWRKLCVDLFNEFHVHCKYDDECRPVYNLDPIESAVRIARIFDEIRDILLDEQMECEFKLETKLSKSNE